MTKPSPLLFAMANAQRHPDLIGLRTIGETTIADVPGLDPASLILGCSDGATLAVRYLSATDVLHGIRQRTLGAIALGLVERSPWAYIAIGGILHSDRDGRVRSGDTITGWAWGAYQGALLSLQEAGVGVLHLLHADHLPDALLALAGRDRAPKRVQRPRAILWQDPKVEMLMAIPGVGESLADDVLCATGGDVGAALLALTSDETVVKGVGPKTREAARALLGGVVGPLEPMPAKKRN